MARLMTTSKATVGGWGSGREWEGVTGAGYIFIAEKCRPVGDGSFVT